MPDYWQAEPGPGVWLQGPGVPELVSDRYWGLGDLVPDTVEYGIRGIPQVVLAC